MRFNEITQLTEESIAFQKNDPFGPELEAIITKYVKLAEDGLNKHQIDDDLELKYAFQKLIFNRFGMTVVLTCDKHLAACIPNVYTNDSGMVRSAMKAALDADGSFMGVTQLKSLESGTDLGTVNLQTAKITGWLSKQPVPIYMDFRSLSQELKLTVPEITAVCLHELGHIFMSASAAYTVNRKNMVISDIVKHVIKNGRDVDTKYIYKEFQKIDIDVSEETIEGLSSDSVTVFGVSAFRTALGATRSISGSSKYDDTANESMADSFAVRMGYALPLVSGLDKLLNDPMRKATQLFITAFNLWMTFRIVRSIINLLSLLGKVPTHKILYSLVFNTIQAVIIFSLNRYAKYDYEYDEDPDRFKRIKQNAIEQIKDHTLSNSLKLTLIDQIKFMEEVEKRTLTIPNPIRIASSLLLSSDRLDRRSVAAQQKIEELLANQLFVAAAKLSSK